MKNTFNNPLKTFNDNNALAIKKMGGAQAAFKKSLRKAQTGETGAPETVAAPVEDKPKAKDYVNMSKKDFRAEKQGAKRAKKLEDIASGANRERADKILNTVGNIAATAANVTNVVSDIKNRKNSNNNNGEPPFQKGGTAKEKAQAAVDRAKIQYGRDFAAMKRKRGLVPPPTPISKSIQTPSYSKYKSGGVTKSLSKAQVGNFVDSPKKPATKTYKIGDPTPSGRFVKTPQDIERLNKMERLNSYGRPVDKYTKPVVKPIPEQKSGGSTKALPKAQLGKILAGASTLKKIYNMYNTAKQSSKLNKLPTAKKVKKSGVTKLMSKSFNAIKNKKK